MSSKLEIVLNVVQSGMENFKKAGDSVDFLKNKMGENGLSGTTKTLNSHMLKTPALIGAAALAVTAATAVFANATTKSMAFAESIKKQAETAQMAVGEFQSWKHVVDQADVSSEVFTKSISKLTENAYAAYTGNKDLTGSFKALGVSVTDANGKLKSTEQITNDTLYAIAAIVNPIERAAMAKKLLGKSAAELNPLLKDGAEALRKQKDEAYEFGQVLSYGATKDLTAAGDAFDLFKKASSVATAELISKAMPALTELAVLAARAAGSVSKIFSHGRRSDVEELNAKIEQTRDKIFQVNKILEEQAKLGFKDTAAYKSREEWLQRIINSVSTLQTKLDEAKQKELDIANSDAALAAQQAKEESDKKSAEEKEKLDKKIALASIKLQNDVNKDREKSYDDAQRAYEQSQAQKRESLSASIDAQIALEDNQYKRERLELNKWLGEQRRLYEGNAEALTNLKQTYADKWKAIDKKEVSDTNAKNKKIADDYKAEIDRTQQKLYKNNQEAVQLEKNKRAAAREAGMGALEDLKFVLGESAKKSKEAARAYKVVASGEAMIDAVVSAGKAFKAMLSVGGPVGIALGAAAAAAALAAGGARVAMINKQSFASGGLVTSPIIRVGEMGPEDMIAPVGSRIFNHNQTLQNTYNNDRSAVFHVTLNDQGSGLSRKLYNEIRYSNSGTNQLIETLVREIQRRA